MTRHHNDASRCAAQLLSGDQYLEMVIAPVDPLVQSCAEDESVAYSYSSLQGSKIIRQMVPLGFDTFPVVTRIYASPFGNNVASQRVLEKAGFTLEAKLLGTLVKNGKVEDEWIYAVRR